MGSESVLISGLSATNVSSSRETTGTEDRKLTQGKVRTSRNSDLEAHDSKTPSIGEVRARVTLSRITPTNQKKRQSQAMNVLEYRAMGRVAARFVRTLWIRWKIYGYPG